MKPWWTLDEAAAPVDLAALDLFALPANEVPERRYLTRAETAAASREVVRSLRTMGERVPRPCARRARKNGGAS